MKDEEARCWPLAYIAGPYAGATPADVERNVARAVLVGQAALAQGLCPIIPHCMGFLGLHGHPFEAAPEVREQALAHGVSLARAVAYADGELWVLLTDDLQLSAGTKLEKEEFLDAGGRDVRYVRVSGPGYEDTEQLMFVIELPGFVPREG